jgi:hypothetical protein
MRIVSDGLEHTDLPVRDARYRVDGDHETIVIVSGHRYVKLLLEMEAGTNDSTRIEVEVQSEGA